MTLEEFKEYLERKIAYYTAEMKRLSSLNEFDFDTWHANLLKKVAVNNVLETFTKNFIQNEKDA